MVKMTKMPKILIVDDDEDLLLGLQAVLKKKGYTVEITTKGSETFTKIHSFKPDLILLDVLLSGKDGRDICRQIKADGATKDIYVIMISAHPSAMRSMQEISANDFVAKPFDVDDLLLKLNSILMIPLK